MGAPAVLMSRCSVETLACPGRFGWLSVTGREARDAEDVEIGGAGRPGGAGGGSGGAPGVRQPLLAAGLHAAPALRPSRAAPVPADRLPGRRGAHRRVVRTAAR